MSLLMKLTVGQCTFNFLSTNRDCQQSVQPGFVSNLTTIDIINYRMDISESLRGSQLSSRGDRRCMSANYFLDNKVRSCSFVRQKQNKTFEAVPYYIKRSGRYPTPSTYKKSWSAKVHAKHLYDHAASGTIKTPVTYRPNRQRNQLQPPDFSPKHPSHSTVRLGDQQTFSSSEWQSSYNHYYKGRQDPKMSPYVFRKACCCPHA